MMLQKPVVLILAAGAGSRFGGLKQFNEIGPCGETIIDYSIYDSLAAGFEKIILVVKPEMIDTLTKKFIDRYHLPVEFCIQKDEIVYHEKKIKRDKPWGTAYAVYSAREKIDQPFLVINGDDFYGKNSFQLAYDFLMNERKNCLIVFPLNKTLSEFGKVNRAEIISRDNMLCSIIERTNIFVSQGKIHHDDQSANSLQLNSFVSLNMWGFNSDFFTILENELPHFLNDLKQNPELEYQLPNVINAALFNQSIKIEMIPTAEEWIGLTYKKDIPLAVQRVREKDYPSPLW